VVEAEEAVEAEETEETVEAEEPEEPEETLEAVDIETLQNEINGILFMCFSNSVHSDSAFKAQNNLETGSLFHLRHKQQMFCSKRLMSCQSGFF